MGDEEENDDIVGKEYPGQYLRSFSKEVNFAFIYQENQFFFLLRTTPYLM